MRTKFVFSLALAVTAIVSVAGCATKGGQRVASFAVTTAASAEELLRGAHQRAYVAQSDEDLTRIEMSGGGLPAWRALYGYRCNVGPDPGAAALATGPCAAFRARGRAIDALILSLNGAAKTVDARDVGGGRVAAVAVAAAVAQATAAFSDTTDLPGLCYRNGSLALVKKADPTCSPLPPQVTEIIIALNGMLGNAR